MKLKKLRNQLFLKSADAIESTGNQLIALAWVLRLSENVENGVCNCFACRIIRALGDEQPLEAVQACVQIPYEEIGVLDFGRIGTKTRGEA